jgi:hypothetical protein
MLLKAIGKAVGRNLVETQRVGTINIIGQFIGHEVVLDDLVVYMQNVLRLD